jgi:hypothetical protein
MKSQRWFLLVLSVLFLCARSTPTEANQTLSAAEQKVIDYLVKDWGEDYSVTTVDIAMKAVNVDQSDGDAGAYA